MRREVVRGVGYKRLHYIAAPEELFDTWTLGNGVPFTGVEKPIVAKCRTLVRSQEVVIAVVPQALPTCPECFEAFVADAQQERREAEGD